MTITGLGASKLAISGGDLPGAGNYGIFDIQGGSKGIKVTISSLTLENGNAVAAGGAIEINNHDGNVAIDKSAIKSNFAGGAGTGVTGRGAAIDLENGSLTVSGTTISGNIAGSNLGGSAYGGGLYIAANGHATVTKSTISGNTAAGGLGVNGRAGADYKPGYAGGDGGTAAGGGIFCKGALVLTASTVSGNNTVGGAGGAGGTGGYNGPYVTGIGGGNGGAGGKSTGAGIFISGAAAATIKSSTISGNSTIGGMGGKGGTGGLGGSGGEFNYNGYNGGNGGNAGAGGKSLGGAIFSNEGATVKIQSSTVSGNTATAGAGGAGGQGGAGGVGWPGVTGLEPGSNGYTGKTGASAPATFSYGGGILANGASLSLIQDTVALNAADIGGGIRLNSMIQVQIFNSTIALNTAHTTGGGISSVLSPIYAVSTVIGQNTAPANSDLNGGTIAASDCLIQTLGDATVYNIGGTLTNIDPMLSTTLTLNGGLTEVLVPLAFSPVIGAGSNPDHLTLDQSGHARTIHGKIDIGAVEV
jgi:hypothetical protein